RSRARTERTAGSRRDQSELTVVRVLPKKAPPPRGFFCEEPWKSFARSRAARIPPHHRDGFPQAAFDLLSCTRGYNLTRSGGRTPMAAICKGSLTFGLANIPLKLNPD